MLPSAFCGSPIDVAVDTKMYNLSLVDLGNIYKGMQQMNNTGIIEMDVETDELKTMLSEDQKTMLVYSYSIAGKVLATDLVDFERLQNHFLIGATAMSSQIFRKYDLGVDSNGNKVVIEPQKVSEMFFNILQGKIAIQQIDGTFSIRDLASKVTGVI